MDGFIVIVSVDVDRLFNSDSHFKIPSTQEVTLPHVLNRGFLSNI